MEFCKNGILMEFCKNGILKSKHVYVSVPPDLENWADVEGFLKSLKKPFYILFKKELKAGPKVPKPAGRPRTRCWSSSIWKSTNFPKISFSFTTVVNIKTVLVRLNSPILQYFHLILQYVKEWKLSMAIRVINYKKTYF